MKISFNVLSWLISVIISLLVVVPAVYKYIFLNLMAGRYNENQLMDIMVNYNGWELLVYFAPPAIHLIYAVAVLVVSIVVLKVATALVLKALIKDNV
jgi:hypothetical protein